MSLEHYQAGFAPLLYGVALALVLTCFLKETGAAARKTLTTHEQTGTKSSIAGEDPVIRSG